VVQYSDHFGRPTLLASIPSTIFGANSKPWPVSKAIISAVISPFKLSGATNRGGLLSPGCHLYRAVANSSSCCTIGVTNLSPFCLSTG
jgi:hypothetical protein